MDFDGIKNFNHTKKPGIGLLVVNLGTPDAPTKKALKPYLREFLWDPRVIEKRRGLWWFILNGIVLTTRPKKSAELYKTIWTDEGSPLLVYTNNLAKGLAEKFSSENLHVEVGMRYGNPSIKSALEKFREKGISKLLVLPLYPQYSATSAGTVFDAVADVLKKWRWVPEFRFIGSYHDYDPYIEALANSVKKTWEEKGKTEKLLLSFHGIPKDYFDGGDPYHCHCYKTARLVAEKLGLSKEEYIVTFQSTFGRAEWLKPATDKTLEAFAKDGLKDITVICPGFSVDCLETIEEIEEENKHIFLENGGEKFIYVPALNNTPEHIDLLTSLSKEHMHSWLGKYDDAQAMKSEFERVSNLKK